MNRYDDFLVDWAFTELLQPHHQIKAHHQGGRKIRTYFQNSFAIAFQGTNDMMSLSREAIKIRMSGQSVRRHGFGILIRWGRETIVSCSEKDLRLAKIGRAHV